LDKRKKRKREMRGVATLFEEISNRFTEEGCRGIRKVKRKKE